MAVVYPQRSGGVDVRMSGSVADCLLWSPEDVTIRFLEAVSVADPEIAEQLLSPTVVFRFGATLTRHGRDAVMSRLNRLARSAWRYDGVIHEVRYEGRLVQTVRTDAFVRGPLHVHLTVRGTAQVEDGKIVQWCDRMRWGQVVGALARGVVGVVIASARPGRFDR